MKYIRTQSGKVVSVSQLLPPSRAIDSPREKSVWRLYVIPADAGLRVMYAEYTDQDKAIRAYKFVLEFMASDYSMVWFGLGVNEDPWAGGERMSDLHLEFASDQLVKEITSSGDLDPDDVEFVKPEEEEPDDAGRDADESG